MKTRVLFPILAMWALVALSSPARAQEPAITARMEAIGASSATGVFYAHMALNSLGDGWAAKTYTDETAFKLSGGYKGGINALSAALGKVLKEGPVADNDKEAINYLIDCCNLISAQCDALVEQVKSTSPENAQAYHAKRLAAQEKIFQLMGLKAESIPVIGDQVGK